VRWVVFSPDGKTLATAEHDGAARLRDADTGKVLFTLRGHRSNGDGAAFSADGKSLATCCWDGTVKLWDTASGKNVRTLGAYTKQLFTVAFGGDDRLASGGADGRARIWQAANGKALSTLRGHTGAVHCVAFTPDGKLLASASWDKTVKLWDATTGKLLATLEGHPDPVLAVAFSPDGKTLASCSGPWGTNEMYAAPAAGDVILWDLAARKPRARMRHPDRILGVAFSPDGKTVASAGWDGFVTLWQPEPAAGTPPETAPKPQPGQQSVLEHNGELRFVQAPEEPAAIVNEPDPKKDYAKEFKRSLKDNDSAGLVLYGPEAAERVKFGPDGLHLSLPAGYPRPATGIVTDFGVGGDFEITVSFELPREREPLFRGGPPAELRLVIAPHEPPEPDAWHKAGQNRAYLAWQTRGANNPGQFLTCSAKWNELLHDKEQLTIEEFPTEVTSGRLRLVRSGSTLFFYAGEGADKDFQLLHTDEFGKKDLKNVRILGYAGAPWASFDVRVTDLHIRADSLPQVFPAIPPPSTGLPWPAILLVSAAAMALLSLGTWLYARRGRRAARASVARASVAETPVPEALAFPCAACGKRLRVRPELAGKTVKCPQCGKAVGVPQGQAGDAKDLS